MRTQLQLKLPIVFGAASLFAHSALVIAVHYTSLKNIEFGALWEHIRLTDLPVSMLSDSFFDAYTKVVDKAPESTYHTPYLLFHLVFGGLQFFVWGCLLGALVKRLLQRWHPVQTV